MSTRQTTQPEAMQPEQSAVGTSIATQEGTIHSALERLIGNAGASALHNFDGPPLQQWRMSAIAKGVGCLSIGDVGDQELKLKYFYVHPVTLEGPTPGELIDTIRCVLFTEDGKAYAFVSEGIASSLATLLQFCGIGPWTPPLLIRVNVTITGKKRRLYSIVPA